MNTANSKGNISLPQPENPDFLSDASPFALSAEEWWHIFSTFSDPIFLVDANYRIIKANKAMAHFLDLPIEQLRGQLCYKLCHNKEAPLAICPHSKALQDRQPHSEELVEPRTGNPILFSVSPIYDSSGMNIGTFHFIKNMTEHYNLLAILKQSRENYRAVVDAQTEIIIRLDQNGKITFVNDFACTFFGNTRKELLGKRWKTNLLPDKTSFIENTLAKLTDDAPLASVECQLDDTSGYQRWIQFICLLLDKHDYPDVVQLVGRDITDLKHLEKQMLTVVTNLEGQVMGKLTACRAMLETVHSQLSASAGDDVLVRIEELLDSAIADVTTTTCR